MDELLLNQQAIDCQELSILFKCSQQDIHNLIRIRTEVLSKRKWHISEDYAIFAYLRRKVTYQSLSNFLICRVYNDLQARIRHIQKNFFS